MYHIWLIKSLVDMFEYITFCWYIFNLQEGDFTAKLNPKWIVKFEDMVENLSSKKAQVCDSRAPTKFNFSPDGNLYKTTINIH